MKEDKSNQQNETEFLLHLYDALWENMRSKENRLWTFLSIYGAAVGLVFAGGQASQIPGAALFALIIVMALTVWAVLIVLNANWWATRNQLIVTRIERRLPEAVKGVVPKPYYDDPNYRFDRLYQGSILVLGILLFLLYVYTIWPYHSSGSFDTAQSLLSVLLLYVLFACSIMFCLGQHEATISFYYGVKRDLFREGDNFSPDSRLGIIRDENRARKSMSARPYVLLLLILVGAVFDFDLYRNGVNGSWLYVLAVIQCVVIIFFVLQWLNYRQELKPADSFKAAKTEAPALGIGPDAREKNKSMGKSIRALKRQLWITQWNYKRKVPNGRELERVLEGVSQAVNSLGGVLENHVNDATEVERAAVLTQFGALEEQVFDRFEEGPKRGKGRLRKVLDLAPFLLLLVSALSPATYFWLHGENIQKDWRGEKVLSVEEIGNRLDKAREDFKSVQDSYEKLKQGSGQQQQRELDERFGRYLEKREAQESYVTKDELETRIPTKTGITSGGKANQ